MKLDDVYNRVWAPMGPVLFRMEREGFGVDLDRMGASASRARVQLQTEMASLHEMVPGLNPRSGDQVNAWLRAKGIPPSPVTKKGPAKPDQESTDGAALEYIADHNESVRVELRRILKIRQIYSSLKYLDKMAVHAVAHPHGNRVHCSITRATQTGRLGAARPELQQIPKDARKDAYDIRAGFVSRPGFCLVSVDQEQLEMRILAHYLLDLFGDDSLARDLAAQDCHSANCIRVFKPLRPYLETVAPEEVKTHQDPRVRQSREDIKAVIYGMNYGKSDYGLGATLRDEHGEPIGRRAAKKVMDGIFNLYPSLHDYHAWVGREIKSRGGIHTLLGRFRPLEGARSGSRRAWRQGINTPMQGGGADIVDLATTAVANEPRLLRLGYRLVMTIHDELVGEAPEAHAEEAGTIVAKHMEDAYKLLVPLKAAVGLGSNWRACK